MKDSIAILWDVENVTPSSNSLFVSGLIEYANEIGRVSVAIAYSDWTRSGMKSIAEVLSENSFELTHVPHNKQKNSSDITLIARAIEIIYQYPHLKKILLVTGDADFRPLLQSMRKHGIETTIICDAKSASEDLLLLADVYKDYRELIPVPGDDSSADDDERDERDERGAGREGRDQSRHNRLSFEESVELLKEAVAIMLRNKKPTTMGAVKIRMKLLNGTFNEKEMRSGRTKSGEKSGDPKAGKEIRFRSWKDFVLAAAKADPAIELTYTENDVVIGLRSSANKSSGLASATQTTPAIKIPEIVRQLLLAIKNCQSAQSQDGWVPYSMVSQYLIDIGIDIREHNYSRVRNLIESAEKRNLVETRSVNQHWSVRLSPEGATYT